MPRSCAYHREITEKRKSLEKALSYTLGLRDVYCSGVVPKKMRPVVLIGA